MAKVFCESPDEDLQARVTALEEKVADTYYGSFSDVPITSGFRMFHVSYVNAADANAPITTSGTYWWNVLQFGRTDRLTQIAICAYNNHNKIFIRTKHDATWNGWYEFDGI